VTRIILFGVIVEERWIRTDRFTLPLRPLALVCC